MPKTGYSAALISLVGRMLSQDPNNRPNASEILQSPPVRDYVSTASCALLFFLCHTYHSIHCDFDERYAKRTSNYCLEKSN